MGFICVSEILSGLVFYSCVIVFLVFVFFIQVVFLCYMFL
ncbi:putative membrane protein [Neisseria meningitidis N1568]|nr:putative membrane protein [Neisseria meningitidis N1568]